MSAEERNELAVKALADIEKLWEDYDDSLKITYTHNRAMLLSLRGEHAAALKNAFQYELKKENIGTGGGVLRKRDLIELYLHTGSRFPYCRVEIPNLIQSTHAKVCVIVARVIHGDLWDEERKELASKALADIQKLWDTGDPGLRVNLTHNRATLLSYCGDHKAALKALKEAIPVFTEMAETGAMAVALLEKCKREDLDFIEEAMKLSLAEPGSGLLETDLVGLYFEIAKVQQKLEDWRAVWDTLQYVCDNFQILCEMTTHEQMEVFPSSQQCANQMKAYIYSTQFGEAIMDQNRFYPTVHKATVIAYRELGNIEEARKLAAGANLFEATWDDENKKKNWKVWREFT